MNTTDQSTIATNGVAPHVGESFVDYPARVRAEVKPGGTGSIPYRLRRAATIVDVMSSPDVEIISAAFGRRRVDLRALAEGGGVVSMADALGAEPCEALGGTFCVIKVRNKSDKAKQLEISLRVSNEHGPEVEDQSPFRMNVEKPSGATKPRSANGEAKSRSTNGETKPRIGKPPTTAVEKKKERAVEVITVPVFVQPPPGNKVVVLFRGYAVTLNCFLTSCVPIGIQQRPMITHRLAQAHRRAAGAPASLRMGEVAIILPEADVEQLYRAIQRSGEYRLRRGDHAPRIHAAIKKALTGKSGDVVAAPVKKLAVTSLVQPTPPGMNGEDHSEPDQEAAAMLASDFEHDT